MKKIKAESLDTTPNPPTPKNVPDYKRPDFKPKKRPMKKILTVLRKTVSGENKVGESIHGLLDNFPVANQIVAKFFKAFGLDGDERNNELKDALTVRNIVALILSMLFLFGYISIDDIRQLITVLGEFL